ncbi:MAG: sialate O-acetylesterase [Rubripirellula sp.]|nr:sialate O-acetylesterase [Rubripirellula sp.]
MNLRFTLLCVFVLAAFLVSVAEAKPLKVFILAGQSNMDGQAHIRTIDFLGEDKDPSRAALLKIFKPDGKTLMTRDDVWVANNVNGNLQPGFGGRRDYSKLGSNIGPEYSFGYYLGEAFDEQVLLIKYAPGGQSLYVNFRPPSAGKTGKEKLDNQMLTQETADQWNDGKVEPVVGLQYRKMVRFVQNTLENLKTDFPDYDEKAGYEIAGFVWFQGFNDLFDETGRKQYGANLVHLIHDVRAEFDAPKMPVVVGVLGVNGPHNEHNPKQKDVREGQRFINTVPELQGNAKAIETATLLDARVVALTAGGWLPEYDRDFKTDPIRTDERAMLNRATSNKGFHYSGEGRFFILVGKAFAETMQELIGLNAQK